MSILHGKIGAYNMFTEAWQNWFCHERKIKKENYVEANFNKNKFEPLQKIF